jgi:hypothetical protein
MSEELITKTEAARRLRVRFERARRMLETIPARWAAKTGAPPEMEAALAALLREELDAQEVLLEEQITALGLRSADDA